MLFALQVYLGSEGALDVEGKELPRLVYVSREKRPGYQHHKKAGAMNALVGSLSFKQCHSGWCSLDIYLPILITWIVHVMINRFEFLQCLPMHLSC